VSAPAPPAARFTLDEAQAAADAWRFNCGPAALAALLQKTPAEVRLLVAPDFEPRGYTNPTMMANALRRAGVPFRRLYESACSPSPARPAAWPTFGLVRVQFDGPWCGGGVPFAARYRHTHWVAVHEAAPPARQVFDVNAICDGGWCSWEEWSTQLLPWLIRESTPRANGRWWPTHAWQLELHEVGG